jgi:hypothetical protein
VKDVDISGELEKTSRESAQNVNLPIGMCQEKMRSEDLNLLAQLTESLENSVEKLEKYKRRKKIKEFKEVKKEILKFQKQIQEILEND